jgi:GNAT superfamily N-acetyltransferase
VSASPFAVEVKHFTSVDYRDRFALVAILDDQIVGVGRYERHDLDAAEIAFVVADAEQNRGIGSLMLADLARIARSQGIVAFDADTLTTSDSLVRMFRGLGFDVRTTDRAGVLHLEFRIGSPDGSTEPG